MNDQWFRWEWELIITMQQELQNRRGNERDAFLRDDDCCDVKCQVEETGEANFLAGCKGKNSLFYDALVEKSYIIV